MALDFELSEEQKMIKKTASDLMKKFDPRMKQLRKMILKEHKFPQEIWDALAEAGFVGSVIPEEYGGTGMGLLALTFAMEEMASRGFGNTMLMLTAMDSSCIIRNGTEELKKRFLPEIAKGKCKLCFALTEPNAGSNTFRLETIARRSGNSAYKINGSKMFITGSDVADYMLLVCRTKTVDELKKESLPKAFGLSLFLVDTKSKGMEMKPIPTRGIEGMTQFALFFDDMEVPAENLVGKEHEGTFALFNSLNPERILAAAMALGVTDYLIKTAVQYACERKVFKDTPIGAHQAIQHPLAEVKIESEAARLMTYKAAWAYDQGKNPGEVGTYADMAKYLAAEVAIKASDRAIETLGGYGFSEEYSVIYSWEGLRLLRTAPITKEMILNYVSEHVLGLPRSY